MYNLDDKDLDRMSREASENYRAPGTPSWENLEKTLAKEMPQEKKKRRGFILWLILLGLLAGGSIYYFGTRHISPVENGVAAVHNNKNETDKEKNDPGKVAATPNSNSESKNNKSILPVSPVTNKNSVPANPNHSHSASAANSNQRSIEKDIVSSKNNKTRNTVHNPIKVSSQAVATDHQPVKSTSLVDIASSRNQINTTGKRRNVPAFKIPSEKNTIAGNGNYRIRKQPANKQQAEILAKENRPIEEKERTVSAPEKSKDNIKSDKTSVNESTNSSTNPKVVAIVPIAKDTSSQPITAASGKKKNSKQKNKAFSVALLAGLDESTVKFRYGNNTGINIGLLGGYHFNKNWSVHTGFVYTQKYYKLKGSDYHPPEHYWTQYVPLETVDGYCHMWEIPVLGRYTFNSKNNHQFFVSGGLSSYFMTKEHYNYNYKVAGMPVTKSWTNDSSVHHILSILDLSVGFQKNIGKRLSWQVEPYARIPLAGVGYGKIQLSSFGVNFSIQLKQPIKH